jgi:hypothetical protein
MVERLIESLSQIPDRFSISGEEQALIDEVCAAKTADDVEIDSRGVHKLQAIVRRSEFSDADKRQLVSIIDSLRALRPMRKLKTAI